MCTLRGCCNKPGERDQNQVVRSEGQQWRWDKWLDSRHAVKVKPAECVDGLGLECEQEENNRDKIWSCHLLLCKKL